MADGVLCLVLTGIAGYHVAGAAECGQDVVAEGSGGKFSMEQAVMWLFGLTCVCLVGRRVFPRVSRLKGCVVSVVRVANQCRSIPTVGFAMKRVKMGSVTLKCWDLGGQPRFRSMWERYCKGVNAIIFVLDSADHSSIEAARAQLKSLTEKESLQDIPVLVLGNKNDLEDTLSVDDVIEQMDLKSITNRQVSCYSISVKEANNLNSVLSWLIAQSKK